METGKLFKLQEQKFLEPNLSGSQSESGMGLYVNDTLEKIAGIRFRNQANQNSIRNHQGVFYINPHAGLLPQNLISHWVRLVILR